MWPFGKASARQKKARRTKAERGLAWPQRVLAHLHIWSILTPAIAAILAALIVNLGGQVLDVRAGESLSRAITARLRLQTVDEQQTAIMRAQAYANAPRYYQLNELLLDEIRGRLTNALTIAQTHADDPAKLRAEAQRIRLWFDDDGLEAILRYATAGDASMYQNAVERAAQELARFPLVEPIELARGQPTRAILVDPAANRAREVPVGQLVVANKPEQAEAAAQAAASMFPMALRESMRRSITNLLAKEGEAPGVRPMYRFDSSRSATAASDARDQVPVQYVVYPAGTILADAGVVSRDERELLELEHESYRAWTGANLEAGQALLRADVGRSFLTFLVAIGLWIYLWRHQHLSHARPMRQLLMVGVLLCVLAITRFAYVQLSIPEIAVGAQAFAAALVAIVYVRGPAYAVVGCLAALLTLSTRQDIGFFIALLAVGNTMLYFLRDVRNRGKIVAVGVVASLVALTTTIATGLVDGQNLAFLLRYQATWAAGTTLAAGFLVEGILPGIERLFGLSTSMTLLEWCDATKPLMRMMAAEAPGTYNHSLLVGALAESAAEAIGANGLLCRAGSYYHDIGKINKPGYFVENQMLGSSRHDRLSPAMSHLIIIGHVKDGIEMAKGYSLPASLHAFIAEHHGTTLVEYFYHAASQARKPGDAEVSDVSFRYPGPKPQSRETAVVMLCDAVEGAVRAMTEPTPTRIEDTVEKIIRKRLVDGQFDECDLTFRDVETLERSLVKSLCGIYHARIAYPNVQKKAK